MRGFIELTDLGGLKQLISIDSILRVYHEEPQVKGSMSTMVTKELTCMYEQASYSQTLVFKESYEEIKQLIKEATQESEQDFLDKCAIAAMNAEIVRLQSGYDFKYIAENSILMAKAMLKARKEALNEDA